MNNLDPKNYKWRIVALLFFSATNNYLDRIIIGLLKSEITADLSMSEAQYGYVVAAFQFAYAIGLLLSGRLLDKFGSKMVFTVAVVVWSIAGMAHALARSAFGLAMGRLVLGLGEAANFPASVKVVAEWFPKRERAFATGLFNSGVTIGAIVAPLIIIPLALLVGWRWTFVISGLMGFVWIAFWLAGYRKPLVDPELGTPLVATSLATGTIATVDSTLADPTKALPWKAIIKQRSTLAICLSRMVTDWVWWMLLFWTPDFLHKVHGIDLKQSIIPLIVIYAVSSVGGIGGGWLSSHFVKTGRSIDFARKTSILICGIMALSLVFVSGVSNIWLAVGLISITAAAHQAWASNIFTVASDIFPQNAVASVTGLSGFAGSMTGVLAASAVGWVLQLTGSYFLIFAIAGSTYLAAWAILKLMIPKIG